LRALGHAGGGARAAREALAKAGLDLQVVQPNELESRLKQEVDSGAKRIIVAGGDGTIATAASLVAKTDIELAILPGGTLNHFARDHNIPTDLGKAALVAANGVVVGADVGYVNDCVFLNTSSIGAYVTFVRDRERYEKYLGYTIASFFAFIRALSQLRTFTVTLELEGAKKSYRSSMVFIGVGERDLGHHAHRRLQLRRPPALQLDDLDVGVVNRRDRLLGHRLPDDLGHHRLDHLFPKRRGSKPCLDQCTRRAPRPKAFELGA